MRDHVAVAGTVSTLVVGAALGIGALFSMPAFPAAPPRIDTTGGERLPPYTVEWVYRIKWGFDEEFWRIFQKTQIPLLDRQKELGYISSYQVFRPGLHTSEDSRWNYRVVIIYKDIVSSTKEGVVAAQLFPDHAAYRQEENQRWELVQAHYDLPIREIDPHATD